jgi:o-succinylbenzoate synthase
VSAVEGVELRWVELPLRSPFQTSFGVEKVKEVLLLRMVTTAGQGWGECVAMDAPVYSSEFNLSAAAVIRHHLMPELGRAGDLTPAGVGHALRPFKGHRMAKAALEMAFLDAELRSAGMSFATFLGATRTRVPSGVSVGIMADIATLLETVGGYLDEGYQRIKLKIQPGWDIEPVRAVRAEYGDDVPLQVDANTAYTLRDAQLLGQLDEFGLLLIEQPLDEEDMTDHARLATLIRTPVCLDESIVSAKAAADAISLGACSVVNIKPGRVGGYLEARRVHDVCAAHGVPAWCGGMIETGLGRAANIAFAALPGCTLTGDVSASDRFFAEDITAPITLAAGHVSVPTGPGLGVDVIPEVLDRFTVSSEWIPAT